MLHFFQRKATEVFNPVLNNYVLKIIGPANPKMALNTVSVNKIFQRFVYCFPKAGKYSIL
jgi:hypothetical protein